MDTLNSDLLWLVDRHLDIIQASLLDPTIEISDLDPSTNPKIWLHVFYKGNLDKALKILYKQLDIKSLYFIRHMNEEAEKYIKFFHIKVYNNYTFDINRPHNPKPEDDMFDMNKPYIFKIIKRACKYNDLNTVKNIAKYGYFDYLELRVFTFEYAHKYKCPEIINYIRSMGGFRSFELEGLIQDCHVGCSDVESLFSFSLHTAWSIITSSIKYKRYDLINDLLRNYNGNTVYDKIHNYLLDKCILNMRSLGSIERGISTIPDSYTQSLAYGDDKFSLFLIKFINDNWKVYSEYYTSLFDIVFYGGPNDSIIDYVLQTYPDEVRLLNFENTNNVDDIKKLSYTSKSILNIKKYRGEFTDKDISLLHKIFLYHGRYDLIKTLHS